MIALLWRRLQRGAKNVRYQEWHCRQGTLLGNARRWLKQCGWKEKQPWQWRHGELKLDLDLRTLRGEGRKDRAQARQQEDKEKAALNHKVRAGWRWKKWQEFLSSGRRETKGKHQPAVNGKYEEDRAERTKKMIGTDVVMRSIAVGAFKSPACLEVAAPGKFQDGCPWRCQTRKEEVGHDHVMWACPCRSEGPQTPEDALQRRFGWARSRERNEYDEEVLRHMSRVAIKVWQNRYPAGRERWEEVKKTIRQKHRR